MNEQFRKLLDQARELANEVFDYDGSDYAEIVQEKFAELIVQKCALQCNHNDDMDRILEHFGVEQ
jgi:hypothetical protein